jgi:hypothetical protein
LPAGDRTATLVVKEGGKLGLRALRPLMGSLMGLFEAAESADQNPLLAMLDAAPEKIDFGEPVVKEKVPTTRSAS